MKTVPYDRWQSHNLKKSLETRRVILLSGPRQSGKITLAQSLGVSNTIYHTLDDLVILEAAKADPHGFVQHDNNLMIIDEIQRAPELLQGSA